jgi:hypothetical protein
MGRLQLLCLLTAAASAQTGTLSYTGALATPQSVFSTTFSLSAAAPVAFRTWGFGGGTNAIGQNIPPGGFDPLLTVFSGTEATATLYMDSSGNPLAGADDLLNSDFADVIACPPASTVNMGGDNACGDVALSLYLPAGTYTLVVTDAGYLPGAIFAGGLLAQPFVDLTGGSAEFQTCDGVSGVCFTRYGNFAVDIVTQRNLLTAFSPCDVNQDSATNVTDVQIVINQALGAALPANDLDGNGAVNVVDVQYVIDAVIGLGCAAK